jgi:UDP-GlcNAc:undecaprenyl-phosphate/decaprenyl-phosphate GlcNAc-1-phosphate transferase
MAFGVALAVSLVATPVAAWVAARFGVVDRPGPLKPQATAVPYLGGVAVFIAVAGPLAVERASLLVPLGLAVAVGLVDDIHPQSVGFRLVCQVVVAIAAAAVTPAPGVFGTIVTGVLTLALLNAVNLLDGLDGLAAGCAFVSALGLALLGGSARSPALALAGALAGFLAYNRPPARIYLGDAGAYLIGTALAILAMLMIDGRDELSAWAAVPLLVALPVVDTTLAIVRRLRSRHALSAGDRSHVYDQLRGRFRRTTGQTVLICVFAQVVLVALGVAVAELEAGPAVALTMFSAAAIAVGLVLGGFVTTPATGRST